MEQFVVYITPAMLLAIGIFIGHTNTVVRDIKRELSEMKLRCPLFLPSKNGHEIDYRNGQSRSKR